MAASSPRVASDPGDLALLMLAYEPAFVRLPQLITTGALLVNPALSLGPRVVPTSGTLDVPIALPLGWPVDRAIPFQFEQFNGC